MLFFMEQLLRLEADKGSGGGGGSAGESTTTDDATGADDTPEGDSGENSGDGAGLEALELTAEQQQKFDKVLSERLQRERQKWQQEVKAAEQRAKQEAEEARLAEQQNYQELANRRQATIEEQAQRIETLEEAETQAKKYAKVLRQYRDQLIANVPEHVVELLKGRDVADQLDWLSKNLEQVAPKQDGQRPQFIGPPPAPGDKGDGNMTPEQKRQQAYSPRF